ncbi:MAG TPA: lipoate--protein ligase family protein [Clostridium sp.]
MIYINNTNTNPYLNLATEEYMLKEFKEDCFMLWRNEPSIIIGKNQNTLSEINLDYVKLNNIPVVRRLSGGGTVFHDLGNLNFTFIRNNSEGNFNNFKKFTLPILNVLNSLNINAKFTGRNDLLLKIKNFLETHNIIVKIEFFIMAPCFSRQILPIYQKHYNLNL